MLRTLRDMDWKWKVAAVTFLFTWTLTTHGKYSASGDEPHYLMVAESLLTDGDINLQNNYAEDDGDRFGHGGLEHGAHARAARDGALKSVHDIGLPAALLPVHAVARGLSRVAPVGVLRRVRMNQGLFAYSIVSLTLIALTAFGLAQLTEGLTALTTERIVPLLVIAIGISPPVVSHAFLVFPEAIALFVTCIVVWFALREPHSSDRRLAFVMVAMLGLLPWMHRKFSFYVLGLLFLVLWKKRRTLSTLPSSQALGAVLLFIVPQVLFHAFTVFTWGSIAGPQMLDAKLLSVGGLREGLAALWVDRQYGLLAYGPIYWLVPVAVALTWKRTWSFLVPAVLLYVPMAAFVEWWGGFSPAARYMVPVVPLLAVPLADSMRYRGMRLAFAVLLVPQLVIDAVVWQHPRWLWPTEPLVNPALHNLGAVGRSYESMLPNLRGIAGF